MKEVVFTSRFKSMLKKYKYNVRVKDKLLEVVQILAHDEKLAISMKLHRLKGVYKDFWEFHLFPDVVIMLQFIEEENLIMFTQIGSHSDLFG